MAEQELNPKLAIPGQAKSLAKKLVQTDISGFVVGPESKAGLKKFTSKQPTLVHDNPEQDEAENDKMFSGSTAKEKTTRRADYEAGQDEKVYEHTFSFHKKIIENALNLIADKSDHSFNDQKSHMVQGDTSKYAKITKDGTATTEPRQTRFKTELPDKVIGEDASPMAPAPATSDSPGWAGDSQSQNTPKDSNKTDSDDDDEHDNDKTDASVEKARDILEQVAMTCAELYENIPDDKVLPSWVLEKLKNVQDSIVKIDEFIDDNTGENAGDKSGSNPKDDVEKMKPSTFTQGETALAKESVNESVFGGMVDHLDRALDKLPGNHVAVHQGRGIFKVYSPTSKNPEDATENKERLSNHLAKHNLKHDVIKTTTETKTPVGSAHITTIKVKNPYRSVSEDVSYSAKKAKEGDDIGKPGKNFDKIASKASKEYGSKKAGERVAGAILAKLRAKHGE